MGTVIALATLVGLYLLVQTIRFLHYGIKAFREYLAEKSRQERLAQKYLYGTAAHRTGRDAR